MEEWKEVEGWNGKYEVSNTGEIRNAWDDVPVAKVIAGIPQYWYVNLTGEYGRDLKRVHRLVAKAFIDNPDNLPMVDHIDRDRLHNHLSNLRWVTRSQNGRNRETNIIVQYHGEDRPFIELCEELFEEDWFTAYKYLYQRMKYKQQDFKTTLEDYYNLLEYGFIGNTVEWEGESVYLNTLCTTLNKDHDSVKSRLSQGWDVWNAVHNINPNSNRFSFEMLGKNNVGHWFPSRRSFSELHAESLLKYVDEGLLYEDVLSKDGKDYLRQTVLGVYGTIKELCEHFEVSESAVTTMMTKKGVSLEEALTTPRKRVKRLAINGVYNSPKYWYESFGIDAKKANDYKSRNIKSFKETFDYYGVDTSGMVISLI